jgi:hypothetical protein
LTANIYAHLSKRDRSASIEKLAAIPDLEASKPMLRVIG